MKWIAGTFALLLLGLILKLNLLVYVMYVLAGILLLNRFFSRVWTENITAHRTCDVELLEIGETAHVEVTVENTGKLAVPWMLIEDAIPQEALNQVPQRIRVDGPRLGLERLAPGEQVPLVDYEVTFLMRGYYQLGPLLIETGDMFGLHRRYRLVAEPHFVMVLPKVVPLLGYNLASRRPIGEIRVAHRLFEDPTRLAGVRPYQQGDSLNRIHWPATARTGQIHSRVYDSSRVAGATFLLDFHTDSYAGAGAAVSAEMAIKTVAALANAVFLLGQQIGFASNGRDAADRIREEGWTAEFLSRPEAMRQAKAINPLDRLRPVLVETGKSQDRFTRILQMLARLEHTDGFEFSQMVLEIAPRIPRDATVVAVLRRVNPTMAAALGALARQGFLVTAVVVTYDVDVLPDWAKPPDWAEMLLAQGIDFRMVNTEESLMNLCAQNLVR